MKNFAFLFSLLGITFLYTGASAFNLPELSVSGYADAYYTTDDARLMDEYYSSSRQLTFLNSSKDQFGLNIAMISVSAESELFHGKVTLQEGSLVTTAWHGNAAYPNLQEAYAGFQLLNNFWVDAGYFLTHIGGESVLPKDNWLTSHSMVTYFEPFYHAGLRFAYNATPNFTAQLHILNGNGIYEDNNANKSLGWYFGYIGDKEVFGVSYAGIFGNEVPGPPENAKMHMLHNIVFFVNPSTSFAAKVQVDFASMEDGTVDVENEPTDGSLLGFSAQARYQANQMFGITGRFSYFDNTDNIYNIESPTPLNTSGMGITVGFEYKPVENGYIRLEGRMLSLDEGEKEDGYPGKIFYQGLDDDNMPEMSSSRMEIWLNFGIWVD